MSDKAALDHFAALVAAAADEAERRVWERLSTQTVPDRTMNTIEAAEYLGISRKTLYVLCTEKQLKHIPIGSLASRKPIFIFRQSTLDAWLREREEASCQSQTND